MKIVPNPKVQINEQLFELQVLKVTKAVPVRDIFVRSLLIFTMQFHYANSPTKQKKQSIATN